MNMDRNTCLSEELLLRSFVSGYPLESFSWRNIFPPVFLIGILGNSMNLCVLLSRGMRSRSNYLLSALALTDLAFLIFALPHSLANYSFFALNYSFRFFYLRTRTELFAMASWSLAAAIWCMLTVSIDRLIGIKSPLYSRKEWTTKKIFLLLFGIFAVTGLLTSFRHLSFDCFYRSYCNDTQLVSICFSVASEIYFENTTNPNPKWLKNLIHIGTFSNALLVFFVPGLLLIVLNTALVCELKKRSTKSLLLSDLHRERSESVVQRRQGRKVTVTVCAIVSCFILTHVPVGVLMLWNMFVNGFQPIIDIKVHEFFRAIYFLLSISKSTNFFLFCSISSTFRRRLINLLIKKKRQLVIVARFRQLQNFIGLRQAG